MRRRISGGRPLPAAGCHLARERCQTRSLRPVSGIGLLTGERHGKEAAE